MGVKATSARKTPAAQEWIWASKVLTENALNSAVKSFFGVSEQRESKFTLKLFCFPHLLLVTFSGNYLPFFNLIFLRNKENIMT